jgi:single-strand DNA-binding protein
VNRPVAQPDDRSTKRPASPPPSPPGHRADRSGTDVDVAVVVGVLSRDPEVRTLQSGSTLHRYEVTVRLPTGTDTVPVVTFDAARPPRVGAGDRVAVVGRVRRRFFRAGGSTRSSTEVVATAVRRDGRNRRLVLALLAAADEVAPGRDGPLPGRP